MRPWEGTLPWDPPLLKMWRSRGFSNSTVSKSSCCTIKAGHTYTSRPMSICPPR